MFINCRVRDISTISHMTVHNGIPYDKYTATVKFCSVGIRGKGQGWYLVLYAQTEQKLEEILDKYRTDEVVRVSTTNLIDRGGRKYGEA